MRFMRLLRLAGFFAVELVLANLQVALAVIAPGRAMSPAFVPVPVQARTDVEVASLVGLLALTPGTLPVEIDRERGVLVLHVVNSPSAEDTCRQVGRLERQLLEVLR